MSLSYSGIKQCRYVRRAVCVQTLTDVELVTENLKQYGAYEDNEGVVEHLEQVIESIAQRTAEILLMLDHDKVVSFCEDQEANARWTEEAKQWRAR